MGADFAGLRISIWTTLLTSLMTALKSAVRRRGEVTGVVRRRRWGAEEKGRIVAEAMAAGAVVADVARRHDLAPQHLWNWMRAAKDGHFALPAAEAAFVPVVPENVPASRPIGIGFQESVPNRSELLQSRAVVVSVGREVPGFTWGRWVSRRRA